MNHHAHRPMAHDQVRVSIDDRLGPINEDDNEHHFDREVDARF
jgi:hypothetical protein